MSPKINAAFLPLEKYALSAFTVSKLDDVTSTSKSSLAITGTVIVTNSRSVTPNVLVPNCLETSISVSK